MCTLRLWHVMSGGWMHGLLAAWMHIYIGGVSCPFICSKHLDHGLVLVGYGSAGYGPIRLKDKPYWITKNYWGKNWGEYGYYKICRGHNIRWSQLWLLFINQASSSLKTFILNYYVTMNGIHKL